MTLRSAACPRRALARHLADTSISSGTLQSHLCFTSVTVVIHLFLSHSHVFHLWITWPAKCPVNASQLTYQGLEASLFKALASSLDFSKGFTFFCHLYVTRKACQSCLSLKWSSLLMIAVHQLTLKIFYFTHLLRFAAVTTSVLVWPRKTCAQKKVTIYWISIHFNFQFKNLTIHKLNNDQ